MIADMAYACVLITLIICATIYSVMKLKTSGEPVSEIHKASQLLRDGMITENEFQCIKNKMMRRIG